MLNSFQILDARSLVFFSGIKTSSSPELCSTKTQTSFFWKENFLGGLPILLGGKVRNKIKDTFTSKIIPYKLTYDELVSFTHKEGHKICQDPKLKKHLKWEMKRTRQELRSFCQ
jgi:hypothetical protein